MASERRLRRLSHLNWIGARVLTSRDAGDDGPANEVQASPRRHRATKKYRTVKGAMALGYTRIPNVYVVRWIQAHSRPRKYWAIYLILFSEWPFFLNLIIYVIHRQWAATRGNAILWIGSFGLAVALMFIAAWATWTFATERGDLFDDIIKNSPEREMPAGWMDRFVAYRRQLILPILGVVSAPIYLYFVRGALEPAVAIAFPSYVLLSWVSFVGGIDAYWLWVATGLPKKIYRCSKLNLRWQDPSTTPGLRLLADSYGVSAMFLLSGLVSISLAGFVLPRDLGAHATAVLYTLYAFFVIVLCTSIRVAVVPFFWIWLIIMRSKRASMAMLDKQFPALRLTKNTNYGSIESFTSIYQAVSAAPQLPFSTGAMVQYAAAVAGSVVAFIIGLVVNHRGHLF